MNYKTGIMSGQHLEWYGTECWRCFLSSAILQQRLFSHKEKYYKEKLRLVEVNE